MYRGFKYTSDKSVKGSFNFQRASQVIIHTSQNNFYANATAIINATANHGPTASTSSVKKQNIRINRNNFKHWSIFERQSQYHLTNWTDVVRMNAMFYRLNQFFIHGFHIILYIILKKILISSEEAIQWLKRGLIIKSVWNLKWI